MAFANLRYQLDNGLARITLNRPEQLNSLSTGLLEDLVAAFEQAEADIAKAVLITGAGRAFCTGADLKGEIPTDDQGRPDLGERLDTHYHPMLRKLRALTMPTLAAVNGPAAGAGASFALHADLVVATHSAYFLQAFANIGLMPDAGGTWLLPRLVGPARARGMAMLGERISAAQAEEWGLIWAAYADDEFEAQIEELANTLIQRPPLAMAAIKQALNVSWDNSYEQQLDVERDEQRQLGRTQDCVEGIMAFIEKRPAQFKGL